MAGEVASGEPEAVGLGSQLRVVRAQLNRSIGSGRARLDALFRICKGLGITEEELIVGIAKPKPEDPAKVVDLKKIS